MTIAVALLLASCSSDSETIVDTTEAAAQATDASSPVSDPPTTDPTPTPTTSTAPLGTEVVPTTVQSAEEYAAFTSSGITVSSIVEPIAGRGLSFTDWQADNLLRQAAAGNGFTGHELRTAFPLDDGVVPVDYIVAAWLLTETTPASDSARELMSAGDPMEDPTNVVFPAAVLALFIQDVAGFEGEAASVGWGAPTLRTPGPSRPGARVPNICSALLTFYESAMAAVFEALGGADSTLGRIAQTAIGLLPIPTPKAGTIRVPGKNDMGVFQALGIIIAIAGAISPWTVALEGTPAMVAYGVEPAPGNQGVLRVVVDPGANTEWPATLKSCAQLVGLELPPIDPIASEVKWDPTFGEHASVVTQDDLVLKIDDEYVASMKYATSVESAERAKGTESASLLVASVVVTRPGNQTFKAIIQKIVDQYLDSSGTISGLIVAIVGDAIGSLDELTDTASPPSFTTVTFHLPPDPEPIPTAVQPPETDGPCVGRDLFSQGTADMPAGVRLRIEPNHTLIFDFGPSAPYSANTEGVDVDVKVGGTITATWAGDATNMVAADRQVDVGAVVIIDGESVALPPEVINEYVGGSAISEDLTCTADGSVIVERTGQVFS